MQYCRGGQESKQFSPGSNFTEYIFTEELSGLNSTRVLTGCREVIITSTL